VDVHQARQPELRRPARHVGVVHRRRGQRAIGVVGVRGQRPVGVGVVRRRREQRAIGVGVVHRRREQRAIGVGVVHRRRGQRAIGVGVVRGSARSASPTPASPPADSDRLRVTPYPWPAARRPG